MKLWSVGVLALSLTVAASSLVTACSDSNLGTQQGGGDGGANGCPASPPSVGSTCLLANNATCNYGGAETPNCECCGAGGSTYICSNGKWEEEATAGSNGGTGAGAAPACPVTVPEAGSGCELWGTCAPQECSYDCAQGGTQLAVCTSGTWWITTNGTCSDDGGDDAGDGGDASDGG